MRRLVPILCLALAAWAASSASAAPPQTQIIELEPFTESVTCGFPLTLSFEGELRDTLHVDRNGAPVKEIQTFANFVVTFTANGKSLSTRGPAPAIVTFNPDGSVDEVKVAGLIAAIAIPGQGLILLDTGLIVFKAEFPFGEVVLERGPHELFGSGDRTRFCQYFLDP